MRGAIQMHLEAMREDGDPIPEPTTRARLRGSASSMKTEYDFTRGVRGKFYRPGAKLHLPVYLDEQLQNDLSAAAERKRTSSNELVNDLLNKELAHAKLEGTRCNTQS